MLAGPIPFHRRRAGRRPRRWRRERRARPLPRRGLPPGRTVVVATTPRLRRRARRRSCSPRAAFTVDLILSTGARLRGRVVDTDGPIAGAELWQGGALRAVADREGRFELGNLLPSDGLTESGGARARLRDRPPARRSGEGDVEIDLGRAAGRSPAWCSTSAASRCAARGRAGAPGGERHVATSDRRGEFIVEGTSPGPFTADRHRAAVSGAQRRGGGRRRGRARGAGAGRRRRRRGAGGERRTAAAQPARHRRHGARAGHAVRVDRRGHFELQGVAPGRATLRAEADGHPTVTLAMEVPPASTRRS